MWSLWSLWRSGYAIRLSFRSRSRETVESSGAKPTKRTKRARRRSRKLLRARQAAMYGRKGKAPEVDMEADTGCKAACRMKQLQALERQALLSSHLVQLVWYRAVVEACVQLHKLHAKSPLPYVDAGVQTLPLPPPLPTPLDQVDPPPTPLSHIRSPSPLHSIDPPPSIPLSREQPTSLPHSTDLSPPISSPHIRPPSPLHSIAPTLSPLPREQPSPLLQLLYSPPPSPSPTYTEAYTESNDRAYIKPEPSEVYVGSSIVKSEPTKYVKRRVLGLNNLWAIKALHFPAEINERPMDCLLDSSSEVNILPYNIALSLGVYSDVREKALANIKGAPFCEYVLEVSVCIDRIVVKLLFFTNRS